LEIIYHSFFVKTNCLLRLHSLEKAAGEKSPKIMVKVNMRKKVIFDYDSETSNLFCDDIMTSNLCYLAMVVRLVIVDFKMCSF
jgi:hypothetical protein